MDFSICLPSPSIFRLDDLSVQEKTVVFRVSSTQLQAVCPRCGQVSRKIHSRYQRILADLPMSGLAVRLICRVRKFFCADQDCSQRIFVERLTEMAEVSARQTNRLSRIICCLAFYVGGRTGAKVTERLAIGVSRQTLIRRILKTPPPIKYLPKVIGIDDFAFRRGQVYGTLLIDLERRKAIDLIPSREAEDVARWLRQYPQVEVVSRDRSPIYATAINLALPNADQVADRFHIVKNIYGVLEKILHRERKTIAQVSEEVRRQANRIRRENQSPIENERFKQPKKVRSETETAAEKIKQSAARTRRIEKYEAVKRLRGQGVSISEISRRLRMHRETVRHFLRCDTYPEVKPAFRKISPLVNYQDYLRQRWNEGNGNARELYREITKRGYVGSYHTLVRFLRVWRSDLPEEHRLRIRLQTFRIPTAREIKWWLLGKKPNLDEEKSRFLQLLHQRQPEIGEAVRLIEEFRKILKEGSENDYENWRVKVKQTAGNQELKNFAFRLGKDDQAIRGAITSDWSNGQTEGQVNCLKLIKRQMYGRASFEVLKARVLFAEAG
ncbi:MAG: ISL3 family transposase [Pyrinomonadaceae bacterium]